MMEDLVKADRSYRRFHQEKPIDYEILKSLVNLGRLSPSAANLQPLKYMISNDPKLNAQIFPALAWAGYLKDWAGPAEGERPSAYIIILGDTQIRQGFGCDHGIAAQSILLGAAEKGIGGCMIGSINMDIIRRALDVPERFEVLLVLALGYPAEKIVLEDIGPDGDIKYYRDENDVHHVPKRRLEDVLISDFRLRG